VAGVAAAVLAVQWWGTERLARRLADAHVVTADRDGELIGRVARLAALADLPVPRVAVSTSRRPGAFTAGRTNRSAVVVVSAGLLEALDGDELDAVLAHELAHIAHGDVAVMTLASSLSVAVEWCGRGVRETVGALGDLIPFDLADDLLGLAFAALVLAVAAICAVGATVARLPIRALGRSRELAADRDAARLLGQPAQLAAALCGSRPTPACPSATCARWRPRPRCSVSSARRAGTGGGSTRTRASTVASRSWRPYDPGAGTSAGDPAGYQTSPSRQSQVSSADIRSGTSSGST
jgi:heat shock protein HtpX